MRFLNFELSQPSFSIELIALGMVWDLHNAGDFLGFELDARDNSAVLKWSIDGDPAIMYSGCTLVFKGLKLLMVSPGGEEPPYTDDLCISGISKVMPGYTHVVDPDHFRGVKEDWAPGEPFGLLFDFQSGRSIKIEAETVEFRGIPC